jgi:hypothetical protein
MHGSMKVKIKSRQTLTQSVIQTVTDTAIRRPADELNVK